MNGKRKKTDHKKSISIEKKIVLPGTIIGSSRFKSKRGQIGHSYAMYQLYFLQKMLMWKSIMPGYKGSIGTFHKDTLFFIKFSC